MGIVRFQLGLFALAFAFAAAPSASASAPFVLAQFFEHFDDEPEDVAPPADDPAAGGPELDGLDLPDLNGGMQSAEPQFMPDAPQGTLEQGTVELGGIPPAFDAADRPKLLAELYEKLGQAGSQNDAAPIIRSIEELWTISGSDTVDLLMNRAAQFANASELDLSLSVLDAVVDIAPAEAEAWYLRAKVNVLAGKPERALADLRRALNLDAQHYRAITDLGLVLEQLGAKKEALDAYRRALAINPYMDDAKAGVDALQREVEGQDI